MARLFTDTLHAAMTLAKEEAEERGHPVIGTEHFLIGLLEAGGLAAKMLVALGVNSDETRARIDRLPPAGGEHGCSTTPSPSVLAKRVIDGARREAGDRGQPRVATEHLLLALLEEKEAGAARILEELKIDMDLLRTSLRRRLDSK